MAIDAGSSIIITDGYWRHIRHTCIDHRQYLEIRGEGRSPADAAAHLASRLDRALDDAPGRAGRAAIERALADVRSFRPSGPARRPRPLAATP